MWPFKPRVKTSKPERSEQISWGFVVNSGRMSSTGSKGAVFIGRNTPYDVTPYRSTFGIGRAKKAK